MSSGMRRTLKLADVCSLAAVRALASRGPRAARAILSATADAAYRDPSVHVMDYWDIVRGFPVAEDLILRSDGWVDGCTAPLERVLMAQMLRYYQPKVIVEIGTYRGTTTRLILDNTAETAAVYTMDLPLGQAAADLIAATDERLIKHRVVGAEYKNHAGAGRVVQILGDSFSEDTWSSVPDRVDFAFIDASHSYRAVRNDSEQVFRRLAEGGVVMWHDYTDGETEERGVGKYIRELMAQRDDVFVADTTGLAIRTPLSDLRRLADRVPGYFPNGDYRARFPHGPTPWIRTDRSGAGAPTGPG